MYINHRTHRDHRGHQYRTFRSYVFNGAPSSKNFKISNTRILKSLIRGKISEISNAWNLDLIRVVSLAGLVAILYICGCFYVSAKYNTADTLGKRQIFENRTIFVIMDVTRNNSRYLSTIGNNYYTDWVRIWQKEE